MSASILVVEDEAIIARDIQKTLERLGYVVPPPVASGEHALDAIVAHRPDLVLMDIRIQGTLDGVETAALIGKSHGTPVVYLTSYSDDATLARAKVTGAYGYLRKPFEDRDLRAAIEVALQKRELELLLSERERWFATTLKSIGDAVIATDVRQRITFMNVVAERITGWASKEAEGRPLGEIFRLVDPKTGATLNSRLDHTLQEGFAVDLAPALLAPRHGGHRSISDSAAAIVDEAGKTLGGVVVFRDVTEQRKLETRLAQSERLAAIGVLSAGMAHEINNPLSYMLTNVSFAVDGLREVRERLHAFAEPEARASALRIDEIMAALADAREGSERVHGIVHDLKKFARIEKAETSVLDLREVIDSAIRMTENVVGHHARVRREYGTTPLVEAGESELGQVFIHLLENAAQALGESQVESSEIVVATRTDEAGRAIAEIRDTGAGIPPEALPYIFNPFFTTKPVGQGTGLGLSIAHAVVESLGGTIAVESHVGKGTTFRIALPPAKPRASKRVPVGQAAAVRRARVLVIDDEPAIGRATSRLLQRDHDVFVVQSAREALTRVAAGEDFDIVLCDLMMPEMTGMEFFEALRRNKPELARRIVFVTGGALSVATEEFLRASSHATMSKPVDPRALRRIVAEYLLRAASGGEGRARS